MRQSEKVLGQKQSQTVLATHTVAANVTVCVFSMQHDRMSGL